MIKSCFVLLSLTLFAGCGSPSVKANAGNLTQHQANAITAKCGAPTEMLVVADGKLILTQAKNFEVTSCIMKNLDSAGVTNFDGSVGSAMYRTPDR